MILTGKPLRSVYRVIARDGHVVWFHCEAKMLRRADGQPCFTSCAKPWRPWPVSNRYEIYGTDRCP